MTTNWAVTPASSAQGRRATIAKSTGRRVVPIPSMITASSHGTAAVPPVNAPGTASASAPASTTVTASQRPTKELTTLTRSTSAPFRPQWCAGPACGPVDGQHKRAVMLVLAPPPASPRGAAP